MTPRRYVCAAIVLALLFVFALRKPVRTGDGYEYLSTLQAWFDHASPDLRPEDVARLGSLLDKSHIRRPDNPTEGFFESSRNHGLYCWHFFAYPLVAVPAKAVLRLVGGDELAAFQVTNAAILAAAVAFALSRRKQTRRTRATWVGLALISPVIWYLPWMHPEVFTWATVLATMAFLGEKRHPAAALCAAFGALQNPPVAILALAMVVVSAGRRSWVYTIRTACAAFVSIVPAIFYVWFFGRTSLIAAHGFVRGSLISIGRTESFLVDLNQGMLPYVPGLLVGAAASIVAAVARRRVEVLVLGGATLAMILACETAPNWNMGEVGLIRYAVWMLPVFAWIVSALHPGIGLLSACLVVHGACIAYEPNREDYLEHRWPAAFALEHVPALYSPEFEVFAERQLRWETDSRRVDWGGGVAKDLPIAYVRADNVVTKLLVDAAHLDKLATCFHVEPSYVESVENEHGGHAGFYYLDPPAGAVTVNVELPREPSEVGRFLELTVKTSQRVEVYNAGAECLWSRRPGAEPILMLALFVRDSSGTVTERRRYPLPLVLAPGETVSVPVEEALGDSETYEIAPVLDGVGFGRRRSFLGAAEGRSVTAHRSAERDGLPSAMDR